LSLGEGAIDPWTRPQFDWAQTELKSFAKSERIPMNSPFNDLTRQQQRAIINGKGEWPACAGSLTGSRRK
jgi:excinuclease ABC subunit A